MGKSVLSGVLINVLPGGTWETLQGGQILEFNYWLPRSTLLLRVLIPGFVSRPGERLHGLRSSIFGGKV
jgi:hypothetical protein